MLTVNPMSFNKSEAELRQTLERPNTEGAQLITRSYSSNVEFRIAPDGVVLSFLEKWKRMFSSFHVSVKSFRNFEIFMLFFDVLGKILCFSSEGEIGVHRRLFRSQGLARFVDDDHVSLTKVFSQNT